MSQTNEFAKAISPDYVYFDLQSTNTYNNETGTTPQLQFLESRDGAIIDNAGEYNMSVTRFSVDTANLPVLVVEPDINDIGFDPHKTVHRVAIITEGANLKLDTVGAITTTLMDNFEGQGSVGSKFGTSVASSNDGEIVVIGEPNATSLSYSLMSQRSLQAPTGVFNITASGRGHAYIGVRNSEGKYILSRLTDNGFRNYVDNIQNGVPYPQPQIDVAQDTTIVSNWNIGSSVAISGDGNIAFIGSSGNCPYYWMFNRLTNVFKRHDKKDGTQKPSRVVGALNTNGTLYIVGYPDRTTNGNIHGGYEILGYNIVTSAYHSRISVNGVVGTDIHMGWAVAMNGIGDIAVATKSWSSTAGSINVIQSTSSPHYISAYSTYTNVSTLDAFGTSLSINNSGTLIAVGAISDSTHGKVAILAYASGVFTAPNGNIISPIDQAGYNTFTGSAVGFGYSIGLSYDGNTIHIGIPNWDGNTGAVQSFQYNGSTWDFKTWTNGASGGANTYYGISVSSSHDGIEYIAGKESPNNIGEVGAIKLNIATHENLPPSLNKTASVANVFWEADNATLTPPTKSQLNGVNTATFPYYYCHSYNNFIDKVNDALREAYVANFNKLWTEWVSTLSVANASFIKAEFINIVARCFTTPPYMVWNATLDANLYLNTLFSALGNYYAPSRTFTASGASPNTQVSTAGATQPLRLRVALNASLYSLFSSFPATETIIDGEKFYMLNVPKQVPLLQDTSTIPLRALPLMPNYTFLYDYHNLTTGVFTLPFPTNSIATYPLQDYFILLKQEISTIDAWCPISSIVFTSNQLPIIVSQFSSSNTTGNNANSALIGNRFALVITDLMTNQQGYRPNIIYNPTAEYRRITLTGNMGIRNIDINVFWRSKTGQLLPFRLPSGGSATLKLLFEKKDRKETKNEKEAEPPVDTDIMGGRMRSRR
jgi:hypothetical protein